MKPNGFVWLRGIAWMLLCGCLLACSTTVESQENRFRKNKDTIEVIAAKNLMMRDAVMTKLAGFQSEHDEIMAATGPDQPKQLARLNSRIEDYIKQVDPTRAAPPAGSKLSATPAPGSKLGGTAPAPA
ncbi:MAG: hypothetical protein KC620_16795, partial [Myxococcales bacterium]|nr:hypothetical protein [Myxococcales bacterium]